MRLYLNLTKSETKVPFNYQQFLTGVIHKWIGRNNEAHDQTSLYSFSWLKNVNTDKTGISITDESYFFISAFDDEFIKKIVRGVLDEPSLFYGSKVIDVQICNTPQFSKKERFSTASPVFIKRRLENNEQHITFQDPKSNDYLTETLIKKLKIAGIPNEGVSVSFDKTYHTPSTKIIAYNNIKNRVSICPVFVEGTEEQIAFAWNVGVGNSTGIGFGSLS
jgi:CRISPR-associated endoribonuclease Cas6